MLPRRPSLATYPGFCGLPLGHAERSPRPGSTARSFHGLQDAQRDIRVARLGLSKVGPSGEGLPIRWRGARIRSLPPVCNRPDAFPVHARHDRGAGRWACDLSGACRPPADRCRCIPGDLLCSGLPGTARRRESSPAVVLRIQSDGGAAPERPAGRVVLARMGSGRGCCHWIPPGHPFRRARTNSCRGGRLPPKARLPGTARLYPSEGLEPIRHQPRHAADLPRPTVAASQAGQDPHRGRRVRTVDLWAGGHRGYEYDSVAGSAPK